MMLRVASASLLVVLASTLASPVTVSSAWAQHARRLPQNPRICIAAPRPTEAGCALTHGCHAKTPSRPPPVHPSPKRPLRPFV